MIFCARDKALGPTYIPSARPSLNSWLSFLFSLVDETFEVETKKHMFSEPWEESDIILVVEEQKLHVHRVMLSMASPVFKAMLSGDFKEKAAAEIPLPGKKADEIRDLLRIIYPLQQVDITSMFRGLKWISSNFAASQFVYGRWTLVKVVKYFALVVSSAFCLYINVYMHICIYDIWYIYIILYIYNLMKIDDATCEKDPKDTSRLYSKG